MSAPESSSARTASHSLVAKAVGATEYDTIPPLATYYYSYYSGFDAEDIEQYVGDSVPGAAFSRPTTA